MLLSGFHSFSVSGTILVLSLLKCSFSFSPSATYKPCPNGISIMTATRNIENVENCVGLNPKEGAKLKDFLRDCEELLQLAMDMDCELTDSVKWVTIRGD